MSLASRSTSSSSSKKSVNVSLQTQPSSAKRVSIFSSQTAQQQRNAAPPVPQSQTGKSIASGLVRKLSNSSLANQSNGASNTNAISSKSTSPKQASEVSVSSISDPLGTSQRSAQSKPVTPMPEIPTMTSLYSTPTSSATTSATQAISTMRTKTPPAAASASPTSSSYNAGINQIADRPKTPPREGPIGIMRIKTPPAMSKSPDQPTTPPREGPVSIMRVKTPPTNSNIGQFQHGPAPPSTTAPTKNSRIIAGKYSTGARSIPGMNSTNGVNSTRRTSGTFTTASSSNASQNFVPRSPRDSKTSQYEQQRGSITARSNGYSSALELPSGGTTVVGVDGGVLRVASAPVERQKRISFAPDVTGEGIDDVEINQLKRSSVSKKPMQASPQHASIISDISSNDIPEPLSQHQFSRNSVTTASTSAPGDYQTIINEQSAKIADLESKLREAEKRETALLKEKNMALKELEANKKFMATDYKSVEALKAQLQNEHQTNASLIIFNRSLKTQVAELEGVIESLLQQKGATALDINLIMTKLENIKPVMPKPPK